MTSQRQDDSGAERELRDCRLELMHVRADQERLMEELQETRRQRSEFRKQSVGVAGALARVLSERYWRDSPSRLARLVGRGGDADDERELVRAVESSDLFDGGWYLRKNLEVARRAVNPATHYVRTGARQGLNPSARFNTKRYLARHPEAKDAGVPALVHFLRTDSTTPERGATTSDGAAVRVNPGDDPGAGIHL